MNILVTSGNTIVPIDHVRCLTNVFSGRTGAQIAFQAHERRHRVTLLASNPDVVEELVGKAQPPADRWSVLPYKTFTDLHILMQGALQSGRFEVLIHSAAVSDYEAAGVFAPAAHTRFSPEDNRWDNTVGECPALEDRSAGKIKSDEPELWLRLVRTPKLVDLVRSKWKFGGLLVKFKLEVGVEKEALLSIAESSRRRSAADLMVANTLEGMSSWAMFGPLDGQYERVTRSELAPRLLDAVEALAKERGHG
jgi:phosphopantothenoylcysteine synthetase/decarboxylase